MPCVEITKFHLDILSFSPILDLNIQRRTGELRKTRRNAIQVFNAHFSSPSVSHYSMHFVLLSYDWNSRSLLSPFSNSLFSSFIISRSVSFKRSTLFTEKFH